MSTSLRKRQKIEFPIRRDEVGSIKTRMLDWAQPSGILVYLDSNSYPSKYGSYECLLATGAIELISSDSGDDLSSLATIHQRHKDWMFGHITYDYKDTIYPDLLPGHQAKASFPHLHFFIPETVCYIDVAQTKLTIESVNDPEVIYGQLLAAVSERRQLPQLTFNPLFDKQDYVDAVEILRCHIADGDCYEVNFCNKGYCDNAAVDPLTVFKQLNKLSPAPFAAYYRLHEQYVMCASPERYLVKQGNKICSQPIKGTARRSADITEDNRIKEQLRVDIKERAENVMIVDLVRNDLARSCEIGSIVVEELFGIYTYPQVHQMISTVSGELKQGAAFTEALKYSFPMGSMTGAPKYKVMQLIDKYERACRELFSGTIGYITPGGNFDFNVVIRSLFYNAESKYLSYQTGGAITYDSIAAQEWEEMRLKAWALERIFSSNA